MKKIYMQPTMVVRQIELERIIAASGDAVAIDPAEVGDPEDADSRFVEGMLGLPDTFNPIPFGL